MKRGFSYISLIKYMYIPYRCMTIVQIVFIILLLTLHVGHALFEYICDEKQLFKPYIHGYRLRKGVRFLDVGPGFHHMSDYKNVYICVNGLAYLYFAKTTTLSEVYEAPRLKKYAHTCEMYNVQPREGSATVTEVTLHLKAILLLGDPSDYRLPSIQKFTAPYYFRKDQLNPRLPSDIDYEPEPTLYINASSLIIIGQSECTLTKGSKNQALIKVRPHYFPSEPSPPPGEKKSEASYYCKLGFHPILEKASTPPGGPIPSEKDRGPALALINDEAIRVERCESFPSFGASEVQTAFAAISSAIAEIDTEYEQKKQTHLDNFNSQVEATLKQLNEEKTKFETKRSDPKMHAKDYKKLDKQREKVETRIRVETGRKSEFEKAVDAISTEMAAVQRLKGEADPAGTKGSTAKADKEAVDTARKEWDQIKTQKPAAPESQIKEKEGAFETAKRKARDSARDYQNALSDLQVAASRLKKSADKVKRLSIYIPSSPSASIRKSGGGRKGGSINFNPDGATSIVISAVEKDCEKLPVLEGDEGECRKGKPDKNYVCSIFMTTLGIRDPWKNTTSVAVPLVPAGAPSPSDPPANSSAGSPSSSSGSGSSSEETPLREDAWKKEVLELIGDIFSRACDRIRDVKKFVKLHNRIMGFYLTNDQIFNMPPNPLTDTCVNYRYTTATTSGTPKNPGGTGAGTLINQNFKEEKQFWTTLKFVLKECKMEGRRMAFKENSTVPGQFNFIKKFGTDKSQEIVVPLQYEQADVEYSYNWLIDMNWKMFVTVMGVCMSGYETKIPLIASRFFSLYTEDFLMPLRETWVNPKDNIVFQFMLSEFYNGHTEYWMDVCKEASFIYAGQQDYRPPRSLMVNCHSEHNYFLSSTTLFPNARPNANGKLSIV